MALDITIPNKKFLYIIQSASKLPAIYDCLRTRDFILLSYKENTSDTTIFYPGSTWTTGRNKLREHILDFKIKYDYYIFLDEDVEFVGCSQEEGFNKFEGLIMKYKPFVANPNVKPYYDEMIISPSVEAQTVIWYDGMCNAFSQEAFFSNILFPYVDIFDNRSWWMSQFVMIMLCSIYKKEVILFPEFMIYNLNHSSYPNMWLTNETQSYVFNNLINNSQFNVINDIKSTSIFKLIEFLNIVLSKFNKINFIDVGCARGDVRTLINHNNVYSIGIDPLVDKYKGGYNTLSNYNVLHNVAIDIEEGEKQFNITKSLDTSSLYDFNPELTTDNANTREFYIPSTSIDYITSVIETSLIKTKTLKNIIEENNLKHNIIHILKIDTQGNDLNVIKSLGTYLSNIMFIVMESNSDDTTTLYKDTPKFSEDCAYLESHKFKLIAKERLLRDDYDCLYYNTDLIINFDSDWDKKDFRQVYASPISA